MAFEELRERDARTAPHGGAVRAAEDQCQFGERGLRSGFFKYGKRMQRIEGVRVGEKAGNGSGG